MTNEKGHGRSEETETTHSCTTNLLIILPLHVRVCASAEAVYSSTPILSATTASPTSKEKGSNAGVILTATNTLDTLTLDEQNAPTVVDEDQGVEPELAKMSTLRKIALLTMFTLAEFLDAFNNSALFPAIPVISEQLHFLSSETVRIISTYQLTFAAFLLVVSTSSPSLPLLKHSQERMYIRCLHPKASLHLTHLGGGFVRQKIALIVLRALGGIGGALTIPSALSMIVQLFPEPAAQARALALFGTAGAIGNILGVLIGALLVEHAGWKWIFWFVAIVGVGVGAVCVVLIPNAKRDRSKKIKFDAPGVTILTGTYTAFAHFAHVDPSSHQWPLSFSSSP
jgi:MFS family permease